MKAIINEIQDIIKQQFNIEQIVILSRPDQEFGDFATNVAMQLAKPLGRNPREIAEQLAEKLREGDNFTEVSVAGPGFINLRLSAKKMMQDFKSNWTDSFGSNNDGAGKTVIVEYPSHNMAKPYSIGHLRPGNQGWAAKRLMEISGWNVITDNHLGDYGAPFGIWVVGFLKFSNMDNLTKDGVYELGNVYIKTKKALKDEAERGENILAGQVQDWLIKLENNDPEAVNYSQMFNKISLAHIHEIMDRLKISTDYELGESFFAPKGRSERASCRERV